MELFLAAVNFLLMDDRSELGILSIKYSVCTGNFIIGFIDINLFFPLATANLLSLDDRSESGFVNMELVYIWITLQQNLSILTYFPFSIDEDMSSKSGNQVF